MKKISDNKVIMFIMVLLFFKPICFQYFESLQMIESIFVIGKILVAFFVILDTMFSTFPRIKVNSFYFKVLAFEFVIFGVTILKNGAVFRSFIDLISIFVLVLMITNFFLYNKKNTIKVLKNVLLFLVVLQLFSEIIWPKGMPGDLYKNNKLNPLYFVTLDNGTTCLTSMCLATIYLDKYYFEIKGKKQFLNLFLQVSSCLFAAILSGSTTALICTVLLFIFIILSKHKNLWIFDKWWIWVSMYILMILVIINENNIIAKLISLITGKVGFTGRNFLWENALSLINESFFWGYGRITEGYLKVWGGSYSSHNVIFEIMLQGGCIALILWIVCIISVLKSLKEINNYRIKRILLSLIFIILIGLMMEATVHSTYLFLTCTLIWCFGNIDKEKYNERID